MRLSFQFERFLFARCLSTEKILLSLVDFLPDPDADTCTNDGDNEGAESSGSMDANQTKQEFADETAKNAQDDITAERRFAAHEPSGDVTGQRTDQNTGQQGDKNAEQRKQAQKTADENTGNSNDKKNR